MEMNTPTSNTICVLIFVLLIEAAGWLVMAYQGVGPSIFLRGFY
jgi:hypothetical protein